MAKGLIHSKVMLCGKMHATFRSAHNNAMHYCDVFLDGMQFGVGFSTTRRDALREALYNAADALVRERYPTTGSEEPTVEDLVKPLWRDTER